ncbi:VIT family-domain-containing protein [Podospora fimiseda]|uniref:VIT family-domain-containing protein n=1 Tax=Podospora fimiseda TaxID=252190 RepID=A0AAN6YL74_9PEZI|nr:VIT family-domain-containing protein [Podospora fimiseda]
MTTLNHHLSRLMGKEPQTIPPPNTLPIYESVPRQSSSDDSESFRPSTATPLSSSSPKISLQTFASNLTLGFADGLTVPFALTAGLSSLGNTKTVIYAGMAEICAGSISMGIGGYLAARSDHQSSTQNPTSQSTEHLLQDQEKPIPFSEWKTQLQEINLPLEIKDKILLLLNNEHDLPESPILSGLSVALGYLLGGIIPLFPYFFLKETDDPLSKGLAWSFGVCVIALFVFGFGKAWVLGDEKRFGRCLWEGIQMVVLGSVAAGAALLCVRGFEGLS